MLFTSKIRLQIFTWKNLLWRIFRTYTVWTFFWGQGEHEWLDSPLLPITGHEDFSNDIIVCTVNYTYICIYTVWYIGIPIWGHIISNHRLFFVIECVNGGDLMFHMQRHRRLPEEHARYYSAEISLALNFLHDRGMVTEYLISFTKSVTPRQKTIWNGHHIIAIWFKQCC